MSLAFLSKPIGSSKKNADPDPDGPVRGGKPGPVRGAAASAAVGGAPRVDLMPPEIRVKRAQLRTRRKLRLALFGVFLVVVAACGGTWVLDTVSQTTLAAAQSQQQQLLTQQLAYSDVTTIQSSIGLIKAAQKVGDSTEIDWNSYLTKLQATLPAGVTFSDGDDHDHDSADIARAVDDPARGIARRHAVVHGEQPDAAIDPRAAQRTQDASGLRRRDAGRRVECGRQRGIHGQRDDAHQHPGVRQPLRPRSRGRQQKGDQSFDDRWRQLTCSLIALSVD